MVNLNQGNVANQTTTAIQNYAKDGSLKDSGDSTHNPPLAYALGWVVASAIVSARYHDSAMDAIPVYHSESGWNRFLLTRRVTCNLVRDEYANAFGMILLDQPDAPLIAKPDGTILLSLGKLLHVDPQKAIAEVLELFPGVGLGSGDHSNCAHQNSSQYPSIYNTVVDLIVRHPGLIVAREMYIDDQQIDGAYHPLFIHTAGHGKGLNYDWFGLEYGEHTAFVGIDGRRGVYRTNEAKWASPRKQLIDEDNSGAMRRLLSWLRIHGEPNPATVD